VGAFTKPPATFLHTLLMLASAKRKTHGTLICEEATTCQIERHGLSRERQ
jgi:hypothetical protein